ncbi:uncharacterized protein LOC106138359 [Amyelois transitella]|uniref:uncharacterized protein LOC106138359 n=1 Tax=Amyelois transitella TaxID=680683 RepID=UPI00298F6B7E|nr:uncharacterized protein LOC106138359 [Amyelois transitella]
MKLEVCFLLMITSISNNGKASLESFAPANAHVLFEDTTKSSDASCYRPCKFNVKPRRCHYSFIVEPTVLENGRTSISINGMTPGPPINVCVNDVVVVEVKNKIPNEDISIHWHGIEQKGTPYMDGVPMVTQCPISYETTYKYAFIASSPGTYFYHADSVAHQSDGVYGSLIVNQPQPLEPHSALYDYDRSNENTIMFAAKFPELLTGNLEDVGRKVPNALVINEYEEDVFKLFVIPGFAYKLRLINAIAIECPVVVSIDQHEMLVIATDGKPVKPLAAKSVLLYPGERMDVVVRASQEVGGYWLNARGTGACAGLSTNTMLIYSGFNYTAMLHDDLNSVVSEPNLSPPVYGQQLDSLQDSSTHQKIRPVYLGIDRNVIKFKETDNDFRYISDAIPKRPFFPASLSLQDTGVVQINGKNFLYPNSPILLSPRGVKTESQCYVGEETRDKDPQCLQILKAFEGELLEIALVNEGFIFGSNESYTFHLHGYPMYVVATGQNADNKPLSKEEFYNLDAEHKINRNLITPPIKDTIVVQNKGYTIVRVKIDKGGSWLLECRSCGQALPAAVLINVPQTLPKTITSLLSKCGSFRPPDVLLN